jgi:hypothetical protein
MSEPPNEEIAKMNFHGKIDEPRLLIYQISNNRCSLAVRLTRSQLGLARSNVEIHTER